MKEIEIPGVPIPLHRPRACRRGSFIRMYNDQEKIMSQYRSQMRELFNNSPYPLPSHIPVHVEIFFYFPIVKGTSKVRTRQMLDGILTHVKRPDVDNCTKLFLDCMNGIVYQDDSQVTKLTAEKLFGIVPKTVIRVTSPI